MIRTNEKKKKGKEKRRKNCSAQRFFIIGHPLCLIRLCQMPIRPSSNSTVKLPVPPSFIRAFNFALFRGVVSSYVHETVRKIWNSVCTPRIPCRFLLAPFSRPSIHVSALIPSRIVFRARFFFSFIFLCFFFFFFFDHNFYLSFVSISNLHLLTGVWLFSFADLPV